MNRRRSLWGELFPNWISTVLGLLGVGLLSILVMLGHLPQHIAQALFFGGILLLLRVSWAGFKLGLELVNSQDPPKIHVSTNVGLITLNKAPTPTWKDDDDEEFLQSDVSLCIAIWNQGQQTQCKLRISHPAFLKMQLVGVEGESVLETKSDHTVRQFVIGSHQLKLVTIKRIELPSSMVEMFRETTRSIRIEVSGNDSSEPTEHVVGIEL